MSTPLNYQLTGHIHEALSHSRDTQQLLDPTVQFFENPSGRGAAAAQTLRTFP